MVGLGVDNIREEKIREAEREEDNNPSEDSALATSILPDFLKNGLE